MMAAAGLLALCAALVGAELGNRPVKFKVQPANTDTSKVHRLIVVTSSHLDLGFNDFWGDTHGPFMTTGIIQRHWDVYYQRAIDTQIALAGDDEVRQLLAPNSLPYAYMAQPFVAKLLYDCDASTRGATALARAWNATWWPWGEDRTNGGNASLPSIPGPQGAPLLKCPPPSTVAAFKQAFSNGTLFLPAYPHNGGLQMHTAGGLIASLAIAKRLTAQAGVPAPRTYSYRDVPGLTRGALPLLNANGVLQVSLGSGGAPGGHPVTPDGPFVWRDQGTGAQVLMTRSDGYGNTTFVLPDGTAMLCYWNRDNTGPFFAPSVKQALQALREQFPQASIEFGTFDAFLDAALPQLHLLPVLTQEIGDGWQHGSAASPWKHAAFMALQRAREACILERDPACDPSSSEMQSFDLWMSKIPEHTSGLSTNFYFTDYSTWTNAEFQQAASSRSPQHGEYNVYAQSLLEQSAVIDWALAALPEGHPIRQRAEGAIDRIRPREQPDPGSEGAVPLQFNASGLADVRCDLDGVQVVATVNRSAVGVTGLTVAGYPIVSASNGGVLGVLQYQQLDDEHDFIPFLNDFGFEACPKNMSSSSNLGCNNFMKPGAQAAAGEQMVSRVVRGQMAGAWAATSSANGRMNGQGQCSMYIKADFTNSTASRTAGAPATGWTVIRVKAAGARAVQVSIDTQVFDKRATRLPEALWTSFRFDAPDGSEAGGATGSGGSGGQSRAGGASAGGEWRVRVLGQPVDPTDVVRHGSTHLHGTANGVTYVSPGMNLTVTSLSAPLWSTGIMSPFPTPSGPPDGETSAVFSPSRGLHMNLWNNVWNCNFPTFWPFRKEDANLSFGFYVLVEL